MNTHESATREGHIALMNRATEIARILLDIGAVGFKPDTPITFKSGILSPVYIDNRALPYYPAKWHSVIAGLQSLIAEKELHFDVIAGIEAAGIPHSAALGYAMQKPSIFIRKQAKDHGKQKLVEGGEVNGKHVLLIEDLVTTGGSSLAGVNALREAGATVTDCLAIASYGFGEATQQFAAAQVTLHPLTDFATVWEVAKQRLTLTLDTLHAVETWYQNPYEWNG